jgi:hypothetical protein
LRGIVRRDGPGAGARALRYTGVMVVEDWVVRTGLVLLALNAVNGLLFWRIRRRGRRPPEQLPSEAPHDVALKPPASRPRKPDPPATRRRAGGRHLGSRIDRQRNRRTRVEAESDTME